MASPLMAALEMDDQGAIWFFTDRRSSKLECLQGVNLCFVDSAQGAHVSLYQQGMGHLMADKPNVPLAVLFYALCTGPGGVCGGTRWPCAGLGQNGGHGSVVRLFRLRHLRPHQPGNPAAVACGLVAAGHGVGHLCQRRSGRGRQGSDGLGWRRVSWGNWRYRLSADERCAVKRSSDKPLFGFHQLCELVV